MTADQQQQYGPRQSFHSHSLPLCLRASVRSPKKGGHERGLSSYDDLIIYDDVRSKTLVKSDATADNGDWHLAFASQTTLPQLIKQHHLVDRLKQSRAKLAMQ